MLPSSGFSSVIRSVILSSIQFSNNPMKLRYYYCTVVSWATAQHPLYGLAQWELGITDFAQNSLPIVIEYVPVTPQLIKIGFQDSTKFNVCFQPTRWYHHPEDYTFTHPVFAVMDNCMSGMNNMALDWFGFPQTNRKKYPPGACGAMRYLASRSRGSAPKSFFGRIFFLLLGWVLQRWSWGRACVVLLSWWLVVLRRTVWLVGCAFILTGWFSPWGGGWVARNRWTIFCNCRP